MSDTAQRLTKLRKLVNEMQTLLSEECDHVWKNGYRVYTDVGYHDDDIYLVLFSFCGICELRQETEKETRQFMGISFEGHMAVEEWAKQHPDVTHFDD